MSSKFWGSRNPSHSAASFGKITTVVGDATDPQNLGSNEIAVIPHVTNNLGWGAGFVMALEKKWPKTAKAHRENVKRSGGRLALGTVQFCKVDPQIYVAHMTAQDNAGVWDMRIPLVYTALVDSMRKVGKHISSKISGYHSRPVTIHCPMFGSGIAGGEWTVIEQLIQEIWCYENRLDVTVYEFQPKQQTLVTAPFTADDNVALDTFNQVVGRNSGQALRIKLPETPTPAPLPTVRPPTRFGNSHPWD